MKTTKALVKNAIHAIIVAKFVFKLASSKIRINNNLDLKAAVIVNACIQIDFGSCYFQKQKQKKTI